MVEPHPEGCVIRIAVRPRAGRCRIAGVSGDRLRIEVTSAPEGGEATDQAQATLAEALRVPARAIRLLRGARNRHKDVLVAGMTPDEVRPLLEQALEGRRR
ncbi:DUF167 domain-containing protein [Myxococcota bacterium]|nr:DUF167 domain-containing protein [Myxococcota bacterium]